MSGFRKLIATLAVLTVASFALAACGGDDESSEAGSTVAEQTTSSETTSSETTSTGTTSTETDSGGAGGGSTGGSGTVEIAADPGQLAFTTADVEAAAGDVTIAFENPADIGHDVRIEDSSGADVGGTEVITNDSTTATVALEAGDYTYFCSIPGHRPAGMEGTLSVK